MKSYSLAAALLLAGCAFTQTQSTGQGKFLRLSRPGGEVQAQIGFQNSSVCHAVLGWAFRDPSVGITYDNVNFICTDADAASTLNYESIMNEEHFRQPAVLAANTDALCRALTSGLLEFRGDANQIVFTSIAPCRRRT